MNKDKLSTHEIVDLLASKASVSKRVAEEFIKVLLATIEESLVAGESVKIKGFGTFKLQWNEARKSVNVNTGEEILLAGYHKVAFTPDALLKDMVNEPFAHLEPVVIGAEPAADDDYFADEPLEPLRIFTEQATEIKGILSEIQALSGESSKEQAQAQEEEKVQAEEIESVLEIEDEIVEPAHDEIIEIEERVISDEPIIDIEKIEEAEPEIPISSYAKSEFLTNEMPSKKKAKKAQKMTKERKVRNKRGVWLVMLISFVIISGSGVGSYFFVPQVNEFANNNVETFRETELNKTMYTNLVYWSESVNSWFVSTPTTEAPKPVVKVVVKDSTVVDTVKVAPVPVDSLQLLFDSERTYTEFIASEKIVLGSRLARMAERYYGKSDFWVYIYEANKEKIPNPDNIQNGTLIRIPKLDKKLIDPNNPRCVEKAKELHDLYVVKKP